jgi:hypothetical protein
MNQTQNFDASIPVLTEVLWDVAEDAAAAPANDGGAARFETVAAEAAPPAPQPRHDSDPAQHQPPPAGANRELARQWEALEQRLAARILHQVQSSVDTVVAQCVAEVLEGALHKLGGELRGSLRYTVEKAVSQAVVEERGRLQDGAR